MNIRDKYSFTGQSVAYDEIPREFARTHIDPLILYIYKIRKY